jgi:hypothetical protein
MRDGGQVVAMNYISSCGREVVVLLLFPRQRAKPPWDAAKGTLCSSHGIPTPLLPQHDIAPSGRRSGAGDSSSRRSDAGASFGCHFGCCASGKVHWFDMSSRKAHDLGGFAASSFALCKRVDLYCCISNFKRPGALLSGVELSKDMKSCHGVWLFCAWRFAQLYVYMLGSFGFVLSGRSLVSLVVCHVRCREKSV